MFSCEYCKIFKNTYFEEHLQAAASVNIIDMLLLTDKLNLKCYVLYETKKELLTTTKMYIAIINILIFIISIAIVFIISIIIITITVIIIAFIKSPWWIC